MKIISPPEKIPFFWVDAFTDKPFRGNPAAVCLLEKPLNSEIMQAIASELGLSETAFVYPIQRKPIKNSSNFSLKWFTPKAEVKLCGHATLAAATVLFRELHVSAEQIIFETLSGELVAENLKEDILLDFPAESLRPFVVQSTLLDAIGIMHVEDVKFSNRLGMVLMRLSSAGEVYHLHPNFEMMRKHLDKAVSMGVIVTAKGDNHYDFVSRFFAPQLGIDEDPVTGSSHSVLAPYWSKILKKTTMSAYQASARGGKLQVTIDKRDRVRMLGQGFILVTGEMRLIE